MTRLNDPAFVAEQYKTSANLQARIDLHRRFSTNPREWHCWVFDQLAFAPTARVVELGAGPGRLWSENLDRVPPGWRITVSDRSRGMVGESAARLRDAGHALAFAVIDAQALPFGDTSIDAVIANHMLYHVPDRARALHEIQRVLRPGGQVIAATVGRPHLHEITGLLRRFLHDQGVSSEDAFVTEEDTAGTFYLENGGEELGELFTDVQIRRFTDGLRVTEAEPLVRYIRSGRGRDALPEDRVAAFTRFLESELASLGALRISKDSGLIIGLRAN